MKRTLFIALSICGMQLQAQKTFKLYNLTGSTVIIDDLVTSASTDGSYPQFHSKPNEPVNIAPGSYTLTTTNLTRFPFYSPTSIPTINFWERKTSETTSSNIPSTVAFPLGGNQVFYWIQVRIGANTKQIGLSSSGFQSTSTSNGWTASYSLAGTAAAPIYTVTIQ